MIGSGTDQQFSVKQQILQKAQTIIDDIQQLLEQLGLNTKSEDEDIKGAVSMQYFQESLQKQLQKSQNDSTIQQIKQFQFILNNIQILIGTLLDPTFFSERQMYPQYPTFECERIPIKQIIKDLYLTPQQQCQFSVANNINNIQFKTQKQKFLQTNTNNLIADKQDLQSSLAASALSLNATGLQQINQKKLFQEQILQAFIQLIYHYPEIVYYMIYLNDKHTERISMLLSVINLYKQGQILFEQQNIQLRLQDGLKSISSDFLNSPASRLLYTSILKSLLTTQNIEEWPQLNYLNIKCFQKAETLLQDVVYAFIDQQDCKQYCKSFLQQLVQKIFTEKQEDNNYISYLDQEYLDYQVGQLIHCVMSSFSQLPPTIKFLLKIGKFTIQNFVYNMMNQQNIQEYGNRFKYFAELFYSSTQLSIQNRINFIVNELLTKYTAFVVFGCFIRTALNNPVSYGLLSIEQTNNQSIETVLSLLSLIGDLSTDIFYNSRGINRNFLDSIDVKIEQGQEIVMIRNNIVNKYKDLIASANPNEFAQNLTIEEIKMINQDLFDSNCQLFGEKKIWISIGQLQQLLEYFQQNSQFVLRNCKIQLQNQILINKCSIEPDIQLQMYNKTYTYVQQFNNILNNQEYTIQQLINNVIQSVSYENGIFSCQLIPLNQNQIEISQIENDHFYDQYYTIKDVIVQSCDLDELCTQLEGLMEQKVGKENFNEQIVDFSNQITKINKQVQKDMQMLQDLIYNIEQSQQQQEYLIEQLDIYITYRNLDEINQSLKQQLQERVIKPFNEMVQSQLQFNQALNATAVVNAQMTFDELLYNSEKLLKQLYSTRQQQEPGIIEDIYEQNIEDQQIQSYILQQL